MVGFSRPCRASQAFPVVSTAADQRLDAAAYFPSPLFSRLHDLARLSFFPPRPSVYPRLFVSPSPSPRPSFAAAAAAVVVSLHPSFSPPRPYLPLLFLRSRSTHRRMRRDIRVPFYWQRQLPPSIPQIERQECPPVPSLPLALCSPGFGRYPLPALHKETDELHARKHVRDNWLCFPRIGDSKWRSRRIIIKRDAPFFRASRISMIYSSRMNKRKKAEKCKKRTTVFG